MSFKNYLRLFKPRIIALVLFVALASLILASKSFPLNLILSLTFSGTLAIMASNAFNAYYDRDIDAKMHRTSRRPVALGLIEPKRALYVSLFLSLLSLLLSYLLLNLWTTLFIGLGMFTYMVIYTLWLKRRSVWNIVIGGASGSFASLGGWSLVREPFELEALLLALLVFLWTPSHFWSLALKIKEDYSKAGIPMLPCLVGEKKTVKIIFFNTILMVSLSFILVIFGYGIVYLLFAALSGFMLLFLNFNMISKYTERLAFRSFKLSGPYLFLVFLGLMLDAFI
ncbi:MAG: heme o synthase [Nitrososphaerales archaeon]